MFDFTVKILIVDDFHAIRNILKKLLREIGFRNLQEAEDGVQALHKLKNDDYGFVISDWNMPNVDGIELLRNMKKDERLKGIPFLMVTADASKEKIISAIKAGADGYIVKPFTAERLKKTLMEIAEKYPSFRVTE